MSFGSCGDEEGTLVAVGRHGELNHKARLLVRFFWIATELLHCVFCFSPESKHSVGTRQTCFRMRPIRKTWVVSWERG